MASTDLGLLPGDVLPPVVVAIEGAHALALCRRDGRVRLAPLSIYHEQVAAAWMGLLAWAWGAR